MVHTSPYAGQWYPGDPAALRDLLAEVFNSSHRRVGEAVYPNAVGFVVPHAAPRYSGTVAAAVYRHLERQKPRRIVLLGFSHSVGVSGVGVPDVEAYRTPLGEVAVDRTSLDRLAQSAPFRRVAEDRLCDHSVEIQLPLLQTAAPGVAVAPLYVGQLREAERREAAKALAELADGQTVIIASSDFTHFGKSFGYQPFPVNSVTGDRLARLDGDVMEAASSLDSGMFLSELNKNGATVCGYDPIALLLEVVRQLQAQRPPADEIFQQRLDYQTSGDITGDFAHSVSYGALGYFPASSFYLSDDDQQRVLSACRATLDRYTQTGVRQPVAPEVTAGLARPTAAFVTVYRGGELQGCIGRLHDKQPMSAGIPDLTLSAALEDPRFEPVHRGDASLEIEISVLTPMKRIASRDQWIPNEQGAMLENGPYRGLFLPKVAEENRMTPDEWWDALARKAGARPDIYAKPDTRISVFRAQVFGGRGI